MSPLSSLSPHEPRMLRGLDEPLLSTRPAALRHTMALRAAAIDHDIGLSTNATGGLWADVAQAAITAGLHAMRPAIMDLATRAMEAGPVMLSDDLTEFRFIGEAGIGRAHFLLSNAQSRSAYAIELTLTPEMTEAAKALDDAAFMACEDERKALGLDNRSYLLKSLTGASTEAQQARAAIRNDPGNYRPALTTGALNGISMALVAGREGKTAGLCMGGLPEDASGAHQAVTIDALPAAFARGGGPGLVLTDCALNDAASPHELRTITTRAGLLRGLQMLGDAIGSELRLRVMTADCAASIFAEPWHTSRTTQPLAEELGLSIIAQRRGLFDKGACDQLDMVLLQSLARCAQNQLPSLRAAWQTLIDGAHTSEVEAFDCNDLRDQAWAITSEGAQRIVGISSGRKWSIMLSGEPGGQMVRILAGSSEPVILEMREFSGQLEVTRTVWETEAHGRLLAGALLASDTVSCCLGVDRRQLRTIQTDAAESDFQL